MGKQDMEGGITYHVKKKTKAIPYKVNAEKFILLSNIYSQISPEIKLKTTD